MRTLKQNDVWMPIQTRDCLSDYVINVRHVNHKHKMEPKMEERMPLTVALLTSMLSLNLPPACGDQVLEQYRLQVALVQRRRVREMIDRDRRLRRYLRRRKAFLLSSVTAALSLFTTTRNRHVWVRNRSAEHSFWSSVQLFDDDEWKAQFRLSRATFAYLLEQLGPVIERRTTNFRVPIEPQRRLAIALWWFARAGEYRTVSMMFGVGIATVCNIVRQVTSAILERLHRQFVSLPSEQRLDEVLAAFRERCCPQCAGAIGATHIPVSPVALPRDRTEDYLNSRGWHSVVLQAVVDHRAW